MNQFGDLYSQYYDLLYSDKDYTAEVDYVDRLIKFYNKSAKTILDMGCGTGRHAELFCEKGYIVHGIDISENMLKIAEKRRMGKEDTLTFSHSSIQELDLNKKFDVVVSLFHVISYQNTNDEVIKAFETAKKHLNSDGLFIFDFWYGPAVLTDLPTIRVKRFENENIKVTRIAEPILHAQDNIVDVNYDIFIEDKSSKEITEKKELHKMRYFFDTELEMICEKVGFEVVNKYEWMSKTPPAFSSWKGAKSLNVAVVFEGDLQGGGGYQQQLSTIIELSKLNKYNFIAFVFSKENKDVLDGYGIKSVVVRNTLYDKIYRRLLHRQDWFAPLSRRFKSKTLFEKSLDAHDIDLVYFLSPSSLSLDLVAHNFIITVWDLSHRDTPEFPEVNYFREFEMREQLYCKSLKKAVAVLVDSELGKSNVVRRYQVDDSRVYVALFAPSINAFTDIKIDVKMKYKINGSFIYYPAQFWSHKNHIYIIDALAILKSQGVKITAIFSGSDKGNLDYVLGYAKQAGVEDLIKYIGFAPNEEIYSLYKNALAMVMPSYFGPTNIPPLEAFAIGTPVIYSDLSGLRDQVGDAALLCDLKNPGSLAEHLKALLNNTTLRNELIIKGKKRLEELTKTNIADILEKIFDEYYIKMKTWKS